MSAPSYAWDFSFLWGYRWLILWGLWVTILYTIGTILLGLTIGLATGLLRLSRNKLLTAPLVAYVEIFRCTPLLVQIIWFYYALPVVLGIDIPATLAAVLVLSLYTGAFYAEIPVADLLYEGQMITAATYRPLEVYTMVAILYFAVLFPLTLLAQGVEWQLARSD